MLSGKDAAAVRIFPPAVPVLAIVISVALQWIWPASLQLPSPQRYWAGGLMIAAAILGLGLPSVLVMRRTGQTENPWSPTTKLVEDGPFRFTRNPMYLQMVLVCIGAAAVMNNAWLFVLTPVAALTLQRFAIRPEEAYLQKKFGERYLSYKRRVRRWI